MKQVTCKDRASWRAWLDANGKAAHEVWLVFYKKHVEKECVTYEAAVEEALCVGWIDSLIKRLDDDRYARKFTPRTNAGKWSEANVRRVRRLMASGRMTEAGLAKFAPKIEAVARPRGGTLDEPEFFRKALEGDRKARVFFESLAPSHRRAFVGWVSSAKREETRKKRLKEAVDLLRKGKKLGMK